MTAHERIAADSAEEMDLVALCRLAWRYKYLIAVSVALCGLVAVFLALTADTIYRAEVVVTEVQDTSMGGAASIMGQLGGLASLAGMNLRGDNSGREAQAVLQSRNLVETFITHHKLLPRIFSDSQTSPTLWLGVRRFRKDVLSIREDVRKGITTISVDWTDPEVAARWANDYVALANEIIRTRALNDSNRNITYLKGQINQTSVVELQRVMYNLIETETKTLMLAKGRPDYAFTIVDPAVPPEVRISPRRTLMVLGGLTLGLIIGILVAFAHNALTRRRGYLQHSVQGL